MINLAERNPEDAKTLAACSTILLSAALEQAVRSVLSEAAVTASVEDDVHVSDTEHDHYAESSIWWQVQSLPTLLSNRRYRLNHQHTLSKALAELIRTRNMLVHVNEPARHLIGPSDQIKVVEGGIQVTFFQPLNPWSTVKLEKVQTFMQAVETYFAEVLFPERGKISAGVLVIARS